MTDHDDPKMSPSAMKAADGILERLKQPDSPVGYDVAVRTAIYVEIVAQIIERTTNLSSKEAALKELVEAVDEIMMDKSSKSPTPSELRCDLSQYNRRHDRKVAALAAAKKALEDK